MEILHGPIINWTWNKDVFAGFEPFGMIWRIELRYMLGGRLVPNTAQVGAKESNHDTGKLSVEFPRKLVSDAATWHVYVQLLDAQTNPINGPNLSPIVWHAHAFSLNNDMDDTKTTIKFRDKQFVAYGLA